MKHPNFIEKRIDFGPITIQRYRNGGYGFVNFFMGGSRARFKVKRTKSSDGNYFDLSFSSWPTAR